MEVELLIYIFIIIFIFIDQISKYYIVKYIEEGQSVEVNPKFFRLTFIRNNGAAFGTLKGQTSLFTIISVLIGMILFYFLIMENQLTLYTITLMLIISGTIGNLMDRLIRKAVVDFLDFRLFGYDLPIFNFADFFLFLGMIGIIFTVIL